jgi:RimJ/RimL family protein N-acetyltransferase
MDPRTPKQRAKLLMEVRYLHSNTISDHQTNKSQSIYGPSKTPEDTEKTLERLSYSAGQDKVYRFPYLVHELLEPTGDDQEQKSRFIGMLSLRTLTDEECKFPPRTGYGSSTTTLSLEIAYMYLPSAWGRGFATESISALLDACAKSPAELWKPYEKVHVRAIVNDENIPSQKVMKKCGMGEPELLEFEGGRFFLGGKWVSKHRLFVFGKVYAVGLNK